MEEVVGGLDGRMGGLSMRRLSSVLQRRTSTRKLDVEVPGRMLADVENLILKSGATFGYTTFDAEDVTKPIHLGDGNVVFPVGWTAQQCLEWRIAEKLVFRKEIVH